MVRGGWVCGSCDPHPSEGLKVSKDVLMILRKLRKEVSGSLPASSASTAREAFRVAADYLRHTVEQKLETVDYFLRVNGRSGAEF